jgi:hypothetical protein
MMAIIKYEAERKTGPYLPVRQRLFNRNFPMRAFQALPLACLVMPMPSHSQTPAPDLTDEERALCRPVASRLCFFKIGRAEALRQCLRDNRADLSLPCLSLLESRGN